MKVLALAVGLLFAPLLRAQTTVQIPYNGTTAVSVTTSGCPNASVTLPSSTHINVACQNTPPVFTVSCSPASISTTQTSQCTSSLPATWKVSAGSITSAGLFTPPANAGPVTVTGTTVATPTQNAQTIVQVSGGTTGVKIFPTGGDDNANWLKVINANPGKIVEITPGQYNLSPFYPPTNTSLACDNGVSVLATSGYGGGQSLLNIHPQNVTISGASAAGCVFRMRKSEYSSGEDRHCLNINGASNINISGISCNDSGGDGLYLRIAQNITVTDSIFNNNRRQGSSITGQVNNVKYLRNQFTNTSGTAPQSGIDIEGNVPTDFMQNIDLADNVMSGNAGDGLMISNWQLTSASQPVSITVKRNKTSGNTRYGYVVINNDPSNASGFIQESDSSSTNDGSMAVVGRFYQATGATATFNNMTIVNPHQKGPDKDYGLTVAVAVVRGGGATVKQGNFHATGTVSVSDGKTTAACQIQDFSNKGSTNIAISLTGNPAGTCNAN